MSEQVFNISTLNGTNGFTIINGPIHDDHLGYSISNAGDVNGDGIDDIIIGAPLDDPNEENNAGSSYVVFGTNQGFPTTIDISTLNGINGFTLIGGTEGDGSGHSVSAAGDINGDGIDDLVIGAPFADPNGESSGAAYIVFGKNSFSSTPTINLSSLNGTNGFIINGLAAEDELGYKVSNAGDINKDGFDDLIIAAPNVYSNPNGQPGKAYVIFGQSNFNSNFDLTSLNGSNAFVINGLTANDELGFAVSSAGDVNNDGIDDLIIGAHYADPNGSRSGRAYIVFGSEEQFSSTLDLSSLNGSNGFIINGQDDEELGFSVSSAGDVNNDGIDDIIIGAPFAHPNGVTHAAGISYVVFGKDGNFEPILDLSTLDGNNGFAIKGIGESDNSGWAVTGVGDVSGDGIDDFIISANNADPNGESSGQSYVIFGKNNFGSSINLADIDGTNGFVINGKSVWDNLGHSVSGGGDVNGDGIRDLIVSAPFADSQTGEGYVIFGINNTPTDLLLSNENVDENVAAETVIGQFTTTDPNAKVQKFTYSLVAGAADNDAFIIDGDTLKIKQSPDFETKSSYLIQVITTDQGGLSYQKELTINVNDIDETGGNTGTNTAPTDLALSATTVNENITDETEIGTFITTDLDTSDTHIYSLVDDENYPDNAAFIISGNSLKIKKSPDFETKSIYNISVRTTDAGGLSFVKELTINVNDINENQEPPTGGNTQTQVVKIGDDVVQIISNNSKVRFEANLQANNSNLVKELAVFTVDDADGKINGIAPGEDGYTQAALARSKVVFSAIAKIPNQFDINNLNKLLELNANDKLRFYIVEDGTNDSVKAGFTPLTNVIFPSLSSLNITPLDDDKFSVDLGNLVVNINATDKPLSLGTNLQDSSQGENIDLRNVTGLVNAEFTVYREAAFDNYVGFYKVTDETGGIDIDGDGSADILPGQAGYTQAAVNQHLSNFGLTVGNGQTATFSSTLEGGAIYVPFIIANGRPDAVLDSNPNNDPSVYFTYLGANSDRVDHVRLLGDNTFGFEDISGGGDLDYNDMVVQVKLSAIV
ncbi:FG-GAP repeat protein [Anabaena sphaerica FACHB-251]|uniref:FG-GAP repeat protein n=1 Tax=Anabaena sphaerica FACHB-251 TaxID=2692883 RepID=A0A926WKM0_9NOST|nr:DUF4114 domain-containing protein [Anabaena sphaerica]MBD2295802.1 FG-GAP repeat protein [Anabaena sphaerica FACHB-251]